MRRAERGMSLLEIVIATAILIVVVLTIFLTLDSSLSTYTNISGVGTIQENARLTMEDMAKELRTADQASLVITTPNGSSQVSFKAATGFSSGAAVWSPTIVYKVQTVAGHPGQTLSRTQNGQTRYRCDYLQPGGFLVTPAGKNLNIQLNLQITGDRGKALTTQLQTSVTMRDP